MEAFPKPQNTGVRSRDQASAVANEPSFVHCLNAATLLIYEGAHSPGRASFIVFEPSFDLIISSP